MRTQFHLFVIKSIIGLRDNANSGAIITSIDIEKFFDKESLADTILTLHRTPGVDPKALRLWWKLNCQTVIRVMTGAGVTEPGQAGAIVGQGSAGAAIASQKNLDHHVDSHFAGSIDEDWYG